MSARGCATSAGAAEGQGPQNAYKSPKQPSSVLPNGECPARLRSPLGRISPRFAKYYRDTEGVQFRTLMKAYGIRFDVMVNGKVCGVGLPF